MSTKFKVVIAGAGPGGCIMARDLAKAGLDVTVYEKGNYATLGHIWSDAVERIALKEVGLEVPEVNTTNVGPLVKGTDSNENAIFEEHSFPVVEVWAPDYSCKKEVNFGYISTDRRQLGKLLLDQARNAGAKIEFNHEVLAPIIEGGKTFDSCRVTGMKVRNLKTKEETVVNAEIIVEDTGYNSILRTQLPLETGISRRYTDDEFAMVHRTVRQRDKSNVKNDFIADQYRYAYQTGYQWAFVFNENEIDVGAGSKYQADVITPKDVVTTYIEKHDSISETVIREGGGKCLVGISPYSLVANGFMIIGDAGSQTIPMTGCGAGGAMIGGKLAAETVIAAAAKGKSDLSSLWSYNLKWFVQSGRGSNYAALTAIRNILQNITDEDNSFLFKKDVYSNEMLTASMNGKFMVPTLPVMIKTLVGCISNPILLLRLNKATSIGAKLYKHYLNYPTTWDRQQFEKWRKRSAQLFGKTM